MKGLKICLICNIICQLECSVAIDVKINSTDEDPSFTNKTVATEHFDSYIIWHICTYAYVY